MVIKKKYKLSILLVILVTGVVLTFFLYRKYFISYYEEPYDPVLAKLFEGGVARLDRVNESFWFWQQAAKRNPFGESQKLIFDRDLTTDQEFKSGQWARITLPLDLENKVDFLNHGTTLHLVNSKKGSDLLVFHILNLNDPFAFCLALINTLESTPDSNYQNINELIIKNGFAATYEKVSKNGQTYAAAKGCFPDTGKRAWILQTYFVKDVYEKEYKDKVSKIFENFKFAQGKKN